MDEILDHNLSISQSLGKKIRRRTPIYNIVKWIFASLSKHFDNYKGVIPFYVEGEERDQNSDNVELRINGPFFNNPVKNYWKLDIDINLLITSTIDDQDLHKIYKVIDQFLLGFDSSISIYRYGLGIEDDESLLGCLIMRTDIQDGIVISNFGRIDPTLRVMQSTINAIYSMEL